MRLPAALLAVLAVCGCARPPIVPVASAVPPRSIVEPALPPPAPGAAPKRPTQPTLALRATRFADLPGWSSDHAAQALPVFMASCRAWAAARPERPFGGAAEAAILGGRADQWRPACQAAKAVRRGRDEPARAFFEDWFTPYALRDAAGDSGATGLFTGYYEPEVAGSLTRDAHADTPLLTRPADLVQVDLGAFSPDFKGRKISGRVVEGHLVPYMDRAAIVAGGLAGRGLELAWLADPIDAFFLQIQGSGRVRLADRRIVRVTYDGENGQPYVPIGRLLVENGEIPRAQVSMQSIRLWLETHPALAAELMNRNPSYVFFRAAPELRPEDGPPGAMGALLTPGRSIAVDPKFVPLGAPVYLVTADPLNGAPFRRLMLAQDTGGAIRGPVRADVFWGWDRDAGTRAGLMRAQGSAFVLLPRRSVPNDRE